VATTAIVASITIETAVPRTPVTTPQAVAPQEALQAAVPQGAETPRAGIVIMTAIEITMVIEIVTATTMATMTVIIIGIDATTIMIMTVTGLAVTTTTIAIVIAVAPTSP
jgi:hypothetical protein